MCLYYLTCYLHWWRIVLKFNSILSINVQGEQQGYKVTSGDYTGNKPLKVNVVVSSCFIGWRVERLSGEMVFVVS